MTVTISIGVVSLLIFIQNTAAQQGVNNNVVNNGGVSSNSKAVNYNAVQPGQQINWQQPSNMQQAGLSQKPGANTQPNSVSDIFSALHNVRFSFQPTNPTPCGYEQPSTGSVNTKNAVESGKPSFSFQYVPGPQSVMTNTVPVQYGQSQSSQGPAYFMQNPTPPAQIPQTSSGQNIPIVFTMVPQPAAPAQSISYTLQPQTRSSCQSKIQATQGPNMSDNPMAMLMSQLSSSGSPDMASFLPMLMNSKQEKSGGGMKALLPLLLNILNNDRGCNCPHCGCPCNEEPTVHGGYSNLMNYSQDLKAAAKAKTADIEESSEVEIIRVPKKAKTKVLKEESEEVVEDDDEEEDYDDDEE